MVFRRSLFLVIVLAGGAWPVGAQTIDCDAPAPTTPTTITTGRPYGVAFCVPATVTVNNPDGTTETVSNRIDGYQGALDGGAPIELGKLTLGPPSPVAQLQAATFRTSAGVPKGDHTWVVTPWNCPIGDDGITPDCLKPKQMGGPVSIPFVAGDLILKGPPPAVQKGRIVK